MRKTYTNYPLCPHGLVRTRASKDGLTAKCPECLKERDRNRPNAKERNEINKSRYKELMKTPEGRERSKIRSKTWTENNYIKKGANTIVRNALRGGRLIKQPCEVCGELKVDGHHDDYEKPLEVRWLCRKHHAEHHKKERELKRKEV